MLNTIYHVFSHRTLKGCDITGYYLLRDIANRYGASQAASIKRRLQRDGWDSLVHLSITRVGEH